VGEWLTANRKNPKWGQDKSDTPKHNKIGVLGEFALRWIFRIPMWDRTSYPPKEDRHKGDVGNCEVRATDVPHGGMLLHLDEMPAKRGRMCACVIIDFSGRFRLPGFLPVAMAPWFWRDFNPKGNRPCQRVAQKFLWPIQHLVIREDGIEYRISPAILGTHEFQNATVKL